MRRVPSRSIDGLLGTPSRITKLLFPTLNDTVVDDDVQISLGDGWRHLETLLAPITTLSTGGTPIGDISVGDGPARGLHSPEVRKLAGALAPISSQTIRDRFAQTPMPPDSPSRDELVAMFDILREMVMTTAQAEAGLLVYVR
jgi:Domain of unknown function (DUF1877)